MKTCPNCQTQLDDGARTCPKCGKKFTTASSIAIAVIIGLLLGGFFFASR